MTRAGMLAVVAAACFATGMWLSHRIEPGVHVKTVTLAGDTPALQFLPAGPGPHPIALLSHGATGSKEMLFRYGEALAAAGFVCFDVDLPGHGASPRTYTFMGAAHTLEAVAREVGPVDVFVGNSMGGFVGGEAVREGGMRPGLFIALGSLPVLGDPAPPLLLLAGRFDEAFSPALLKARTDARMVISPWSDHVLELWDPLLVNAAVEAACAPVGKTPPAPPTEWRWRLVGIVLAILGASKLALYLPELFPGLARVRGLLLAVFFVVAFILTVGSTWIDAMPHVRFFPKQGATMVITLLLAMLAGRLRIPRWSFSALAVIVMVIAVGWVVMSGSMAAIRVLFFAVVFTPALLAGAAIGRIAARRGSRLDGDVAMAIIVGCASFQWNEAPRMAPETPIPHVAIQLDPKLYDAYVGQYEFPPNNVFWTGAKLTIRRQDNQLVGQTLVRNRRLGDAFNIYPESETNFFVEINSSQQLTFIKNDQGEITAVVSRYTGYPDNEGKKLKN